MFWRISFWRTFLLRRILSRFKIGDDILRHLSTFQRLGETLEATPPGEMVPVGARTVLRAIRTRAAAQIRPDWLWPYWLERQLDPSSPSFIPRGHLPFMTNVTHRNWTSIGGLASEWEAIVDPRGLVTPWFDGWSLDWWVKANGAWHFPSRESGVEQQLVQSIPVIETTLRVGNGIVRHRAYAPIRGEDVAIVELMNSTNEDIEIAFAIRPYNPEGLAVVEEISLLDKLVRIDGRESVFLPRVPDEALFSDYFSGDTSVALSENRRAPRGNTKRDRAGLAQAALVYRLAKGESIRCAAPLPHERRHRIRVEGRRDGRVPYDAANAPGSDEISGVWLKELGRGTQLSVPDEELQKAIDANRAYLLLMHDGDEITPGPYNYHRFWFRDAAYQLVAMDRWGFHKESEEVLRSFPSRQHADGFFFSQWKEWDSNGAAIWALAEHYRITGDRDFLGDVIDSIEKGAEWIVRKTKPKRRQRADVSGLFPAGISAEHLGPHDYYYWDDFWGLKGLLDAAEMLDAADRRQQSREARKAAERLETAIIRSIDMASERIGMKAIPAGPTRGVDAGMIGSLAASYPLGLFHPSDPFVAGTVEAIRNQFCIEEAFFQGISHTGLGTYLTLQLAFVELEAGDSRAWERFRWLLGASTSTYTWPEAIHPRIGGGCMGDGHHGWAAADFLSFIRNVVVRETVGGLSLFTLLPDEWVGGDVILRAAPTRFGEISCELRWEQGRHVLRWELKESGVEISAPALDRDWSTKEPSGQVTFERSQLERRARSA